ncbi:deleted in malignant brain tumors 1 protein isoform X4 [Sander lucioperca]|uniref:deleted in malignant brain tumors 1 protein isoform X4 n=1 Tax=Sander lucioperca TaxID=283035 RepID=UPI00125CEDBA|nr:deleted in malignant brain tumors 1 protein isoform X4 [Sander lucioperca]
MWTLLVLCSVIASHGVQGAGRFQTTEEMNPTTDSPVEATYADGVTDSAVASVRCGSQFYGSSGTFYSPNYPGPYPPNADCIWNITPGSRIVQLDFPIVNIEYHSNCGYDAIYVYDGPSTSYRLLGKVCGTNNITFHSTGTSLTVRFKSDNSVSRPGFRADFQVVAGGSCRYNCGYQVGNCSCSSSCGGNCCPDYEDYCSSTSEPTVTAQPSCLYNCGWNLGSCSCTSSCQYYGNCCHDYRYYCPTTTDSPPSTAQPSCLYNCGWDLGSCSCSSSCQYYGNCCYDYNSYCPVTTNMPTTVKPCGGSLFGSGTFSSPNHPNYYHDNAYCVWQLRAPYDQRIFLAFTYLQLENCCSCDYVSIYDGPSVSSRYLGKVCNNSLSSFYSTSNYLTVLFRTDGSVVGRGFKADFITSLPPSSGRVDCSSDNMIIVIERTYLNSLGYDGHSLYLNDPHCRPQVSTYQVVFNFPINTCGNIRKFENGRVVYTNTLRAYTSSSGEITRQSHFKMNVGCRMEQDSVAQIMYVVQHRDNSSITGTGRFNTSMDFYTSSSFYYKVTQVPYEVTLNQNLYVQVGLRRGDSSLVLFLDTCVTSPSPHDFQTRPYYLVRNGCPVDNTYGSYITGTRAYARFTFKAFQFLRATESVYIQCKVLICQASDYNSRCRRGCNKRVARDLGSEHDSQTLVLGPIKLKDPEKKEEETHKQDKA